MNNEKFKYLVSARYTKCCDTLTLKGYEYSDDVDRLVQFRLAAGLNKTTKADALWGMATKHITSIAMMIKDPTLYKSETWAEKLIDTHNYLYLLEAVLVEEGLMED